MQTYVKTVWKDRVVSSPMTYTQTTNQDGSITLTPHEGTITEPGVPLTAANLNNIENQVAELSTNAVDKRGDVMSGTLTIPSLSMANTDGTVAKNVITYNAVDGNGGGLAIGAGGSTFIGGGEAPQNLMASTLITNKGSEILYVTSDNNILFFTGIQNIGTDVTVGKRFGMATNGDFQIGGDGTDNGAVTGVFNYTKASKLFKLTHWTGSASQNDTVLQVGRITPKSALNWQAVAFVNNWVNTSGYATKWAQDASGNILVNGIFQGGTNTAGSDIMHIPITPYTLLNPSTKIPLMRGDSALGWCEAVAVSTSYITLQVVGSTMAYSGWMSINAVIPLASF